MCCPVGISHITIYPLMQHGVKWLTQSTRVCHDVACQPGHFYGLFKKKQNKAKYYTEHHMIVQQEREKEKLV